MSVRNLPFSSEYTYVCLLERCRQSVLSGAKFESILSGARFETEPKGNFFGAGARIGTLSKILRKLQPYKILLTARIWTGVGATWIFCSEPA